MSVNVLRYFLPTSASIYKHQLFQEITDSMSDTNENLETSKKIYLQAVFACLQPPTSRIANAMSLSYYS